MPSEPRKLTETQYRELQAYIKGAPLDTDGTSTAKLAAHILYLEQREQRLIGLLRELQEANIEQHWLNRIEAAIKEANNDLQA